MKALWDVLRDSVPVRNWASGIESEKHEGQESRRNIFEEGAEIWVQGVVEVAVDCTPNFHCHSFEEFAEIEVTHGPER